MQQGARPGDDRRVARSSGRPGQRRRAGKLLENGLTVEDEILLGDDDSDDEASHTTDWHDDEAKSAAADRRQADAVLKRAQALLPSGIASTKHGQGVRFADG